MNNLAAKYLPPVLVRWVGRIAGDRRGAVSLVYALMLLTMLVSLGVGLDGSNALESRYRLDLAADAAAVACGETWQSNITAETGNSIAFATAQSNADTLAQNQAKTTFYAQAGSLMSTLSGPPTITTVNGSVPGASGASVSCTISYTAKSPTYLMQLAGFHTVSVAGGSVSNVELAPYTQVIFVLDTSASMMVGSTPNDQALVAAWVAANDTGPTGQKINTALPGQPTKLVAAICSVFSSCANLPLTNDEQQGKGLFASNGGVSGHDITPCAFACHEDTSTTFHVSEMQQGETVAHQVGATTRFDVMKLALVNDPVTQSSQFCYTPSNGASSTITACADTTAANPIQYEGLLPNIRDTYQVTNARANLNTFTYSMYGFNYGINGDEPSSTVFNQDQTDNSQYSVVNQTALSAVATAVNTLTIGLDTHLNPPVNAPHTAVLPALVNLVGTTKTTSVPGTTSDNPLKFVIFVTDGLNSDRNWNCGPVNCAYAPDPMPATILQEPSINATTYCAMWNATSAGQVQTQDGTPLWQGVAVSGDTGGFGQCHNNSYNPGFLLGAAPPAEFSQNGATPIVSSAPPYDFTTQYSTAHPAGVTTQDTTNYDLAGANSLWYAGPIQTSYCATMTANGGHPGNGSIPGVTIAILETPYVPMTGQDPIYYPYEGGVQAAIWPQGNPVTHAASYPIGPNGTPMSALSQALQTCATSNNFYFQATSDAAIATGFITLFSNFVGQFVHLTQ